MPAGNTSTTWARPDDATATYQDLCSRLRTEPRRKATRRVLNRAAGDEVIMSIAGHVSRAMLSRCSHVRMEAKRRALDEIAARQNAADEKREEESERREKVAVVSQSALVSSRSPARTPAAI